MQQCSSKIALSTLLVCLGLAVFYPPALSWIFAFSLAGSLLAFGWFGGREYFLSLPKLQSTGLHAYLPSIRNQMNPRARHWLAATACLLSLLLLANLAQDFDLAPWYSPPKPWWPLLWAGMLAGLAWWLHPLDIRHTLATKQADFKLICWPLMLLGLVCLALTAEMNGRHFNIIELTEASHHLQVLLLAAGIGLLFWASNGPKGLPLIADRQEWALILGLTGLAFVLRVWRLDQAVRLFVDELLFSDSVRLYWYGDNIPTLNVIQHFNAPYSQLYTYGMAWSVELLGRNFWGLRMLSVLCGSLTIPAVYLLGRQLFDRQTGAIAALFLASFPAHIHFSRIGLNQVGDPLFGTLAMAFWLRGLQTGQRQDYILGAIAWGMTAYFYEGGRIVFFILLLAWLGSGLLTWLPRNTWRPVLLGLIVGLAVMAPFYYILWAEDLGFIHRLEAAGWENQSLSERLRNEESREEYLKWHLQIAVGHYVFYPDNSLFYGGNEGLVLVFAFPFFLLGLGYCLYYWQQPTLLLLIWVGGNALGNSLIRESGLATRFANTLPAVALLMAIGLRAATHVPPKRVRQMALAFGAAAITVLQINYYFNEHLTVFNQQHRFERVDSTDAILRTLDMPPNTQIYLMGEDSSYHYQGILNFFRDDLYVVPYIDDFDRSSILQLRRDLPHAFFLRPDEDGSQSGLIRSYFFYEGPFYTDNPDVSAESAYLLYYIPPQSNLDFSE